MVRLLAFLATAALTACSSSHSARHESSSSDEAPPKQAVDYSMTQRAVLMAAAARVQKQDAAVIEKMPVDYRDCVLPVLMKVMWEAAGLKGNHLYVSVFGHDMDAHLQSALARHGISAQPLSALPKFGADWGIIPPERPFHGFDPTFTPYWEFSVGHITAVSSGRYAVDAGDYCGHLCGGRYTFGLEVDGKVCVITSTRVIARY